MNPRSLALLAAALLASGALPAQASPHGRPAPSPWATLAAYELSVQSPPKGESARWTLRAFADPGDMAVDLDTPGAKARLKGSMMLVGGEALAVRGFEPEKGFEIDPLDAAVLHLKIATRLLDVAAPAGPGAVKGTQPVKSAEDKAPIAASTATASAHILAPWALSGGLARADASAVGFDLAVESRRNPGAPSKWRFSGKAGGQPARAIDDATSLAGWKVYRLGDAPAGKAMKHTSLKFVATPLGRSFATVGELRAFLAKK